LNQDDVERLLDNRNIDKVRKEVIKTIEEIYDLGLRDNTEDMNSSLNELKLTGDNLVYSIVQRFLKPNALYNYERTEDELKKKIANVEDKELALVQVILC
jgi:membrane-associated HD superfamily phosphohydrolase